MSTEPNIFNYATKELTQDAFITWLLHWANPTHKDKNELLHILGTSFLKSLVSCHGITFNEEISDLKIRQQYNKIDVFVSFRVKDASYGIIIEDKVHSSEHGNQLQRYKSKITALKTCDVLIPIYFKTGYHISFESIQKNGYYYYSIKDFLKHLTSEKVTEINHDVLTQYYRYLLKKESEYDNADIQANNYITEPLKKWTWWTCARFFQEYKNHFKGGWGTVPNNREAMLAFWFGKKDFISKNINNELVNLHLYMDIVFKSNKVSVNYRIGLKGKEQINISIRDQIFNDLVPFLKENNIEYKKGKFTKAKETMLLTKVTNLNMNLDCVAFVDQVEVYLKALNDFAISRNEILNNR